MSWKLISCNSLYPNIEVVLTPDLTAYEGQIITVGNPTQSYTVENTADVGTIELDPELIETVTACVPCVGFNAKVEISSDVCSCDSVSVTDDSEYINSVPGHDSWGYRKVVLTRPDESTYVWSSESSDDPDAAITPYTNVSVNTWSYPFSSTDVDGVYKAEIYTFPNWDSSVMYNGLYKAIVFYNGVLYRVKTTHTNINPETDTDSIYWEVIDIDDVKTTRYYSVAYDVILCISLLKCKEALIRDAFCGIEKSPCGNLCANPKYMNAMKFIVTEEAINIAKCNKDWGTVRKHVEILKSICSCGSGC